MIRLAVLLTTVPFAFSSIAHAEDAETLKRTLGEDHASIEAISLYPEQIRIAILEASTHPELIVKVAVLQQSSSAEFQEIVSELDRDDQEAIWDLTRFPGLIEALVEGDIKTKREIGKILADYPAEIHDTALKYGRTEYDVLVDVSDLNAATDEWFEALIESYPRKTQESYRRLIYHPEIMELLKEDMALTVLLGDAYERDPESVRKLSAELNLKLSSERAKELRQSGEESQEQSDVDEETLSVAEVYRKKYAYDDSEFEGPRSDDTDIEVTYYGVPYPYWFSYPRWYAVPAVHAGLSWYVTPNLRASVSLHPSVRHVRYRTPFHYHTSAWSKHRGRVIKVVKTTPYKKRHRR